MRRARRGHAAARAVSLDPVAPVQPSPQTVGAFVSSVRSDRNPSRRRSVTSTGKRAASFARFACEIRSRSPARLRPAPRRFPPQLVNPNSRRSARFFMKSEELCTRESFEKLRTFSHGLDCAAFRQRHDPRELDGVSARGRDRVSSRAVELAGATRSGARQARAARRGPRGVCVLGCTGATGPGSPLPRCGGAPSSSRASCAGHRRRSVRRFRAVVPRRSHDLHFFRAA